MIRIGNQQYILPATTQYVSGSGGQQATNVRNNGAPVQVIQFVPQILVNSQQPVIIQTSSDDTFTAETGACVTVSSTTSSEPTSSRVSWFFLWKGNGTNGFHKRIFFCSNLIYPLI